MLKKLLLYIFLVLILLLYVLYSIYNDFDSDEMQNKYEYSCIESLYYTYKNIDNKNQYRLFECENVDLISIGFPIEHKSKGYVMVLANTLHKPLIKNFPDAIKFIIKKEWLSKIKSKVKLSIEVEQYLLDYIDIHSHIEVDTKE